MGKEAISSIVTILLAIVGVAVLSVIVSKNAQTSQVIQSGAQGFSTDLATALSPVTGSSGLGDLSFTGGGSNFLS